MPKDRYFDVFARTVIAGFRYTPQSLMFPTIAQRLLAVLCLVALGLGQMVIGTYGVRCEDASGEARFELACIRTADGSCLTRCGTEGPAPIETAPCDEDGEHDPHPCKDSPIGGGAHAAKLHCRSLLIDPLPCAAVMAATAGHVIVADVLTTGRFSPARANARPPDTVARLRTVILVV